MLFGEARVSHARTTSVPNLVKGLFSIIYVPIGIIVIYLARTAKVSKCKQTIWREDVMNRRSVFVQCALFIVAAISPVIRDDIVTTDGADERVFAIIR